MPLLYGLKQWLRWRVLARLRLNRFPSSYTSHSELGEDMMVRGILHHMGIPWNHKGFFIDIGAHHPVSNSNTWHFYQQGWRGMNVDATPGSRVAFQALRMGDINLEYCVTPTSSGPVTFHCFDSPLLNTLDPDQAQKIIQSTRAKLVQSVEVTCVTLKQLCEQYVPKGQSIDLLSIDIEGADEAVLRSHDWERWRPRVLVFERHDADLSCLGQDELVKFLKAQEFDLAGVCRYSIVMADSRQWHSR